MNVRLMLARWVMAAIGSVMLMPASAEYRRGGHDGGEWKDEFRERGCKVKIEAKQDEYKKEVKCDRDN